MLLKQTPTYIIRFSLQSTIAWFPNFVQKLLVFIHEISELWINKSYFLLKTSILIAFYVFESDFWLIQKEKVPFYFLGKIGAYNHSGLTESHYHSGSLRWRKFTFTTLVTFQQLLYYILWGTGAYSLFTYGISCFATKIVMSLLKAIKKQEGPNVCWDAEWIGFSMNVQKMQFWTVKFQKHSYSQWKAESWVAW